MLEYDRIDVFERTDVNKTNGFPRVYYLSFVLS